MPKWNGLAGVASALVVASASPGLAQELPAAPAAFRPWPLSVLPTGTSQNRIPNELLNSDFGILSEPEYSAADRFRQPEVSVKIAAARDLWRMHSRYHAVEVLAFLAGTPQGGREFRGLRDEVEASLKPEAVLALFKSDNDDYLWGAWLAFLRPHSDYVAPLLKRLDPKRFYDLAPAMLALGNSGDPRALEPLLRLLQDDSHAPFAATALGYLGDPGAEATLVAALASKSFLLQTHAAGALASFGSPAALPPLRKLAADNAYTGAIARQVNAQYAVQRIEAREKLKADAVARERNPFGLR